MKWGAALCLALVAACHDDALDRAWRFDALASDGDELYYARDGEIVRLGDGRVLGDSGGAVRQLAVDRTGVYVATADGGLDRYPPDGGPAARLIEPQPRYLDVELALDRTEAYVRTEWWDGDWLDGEVFEVEAVPKTGGPVSVRDSERVTAVAGDGTAAYAIREDADAVEVVQLSDAAPSTSVAPAPDQQLGRIAVGLGAIYVSANDGLWKIVPGTAAERVTSRAPEQIAFDRDTLYVESADDGDCEIEAYPGARCVLPAGTGSSHVAIAGGDLYYTAVDGNDEGLFRVPLQ